YSVTVTEGSCPVTEGFIMNEPDSLAISVDFQSPHCSGNCDGSVSISVFGGTPSYNYTWSDAPLIHASSRSNLCTGWYWFTVSDMNSCSVSDSIFIPSPSPIKVDTWSDHPVCQNDSNGTVAVSVTGGVPGYSYLWSTGDVTDTVANLPGGNYYVTVTDSTGCFKVDSISIESLQSPIASIEIPLPNNDSICPDGRLVVIAHGGGTYLWNTGHTTSTLVGSPDSTITLVVTVTAPNGCTDTADTTIVVLPLPDVHISGDTTICLGDSTELTASGGVEYDWSEHPNHENPIVVSPDTTTTYSVNVTSEFGCSKRAEVTVHVFDISLEDLSGGDTICAGDTANLQASTADGYLWSTGETTSGIMVTPDATTTYTVTATNNEGCSAIKEITVHVMEPQEEIFVSFSQYDNCYGSDIQFYNEPVSGYDYYWDFETGGLHFESIPNNNDTVIHVYDQSGPGYYEVAVHAQSRCGFSTDTVIIINISPQQAGYNENCCSDSWDINLFPFSYSYGDMVISQNTDWNMAGYTHWRMKGLLEITNGATLKISNGQMMFGIDGKIIVHPGCTLQVADAVLCGDTICNTMWQGIEVWGQRTFTFPDFMVPGVLQISDASTIKDAHIAILMGGRKPLASDPWDYTKSGGKVLFDAYVNMNERNLMLNNAINIRILPHRNSSGSRITNVLIKADEHGLKDPGYTPGNSYTYPTAQAPCQTSADLARGKSAYGIWQYIDQGMQVYADTIYDVAGIFPLEFNNLQIGISSNQSEQNVFKVYFVNCQTGIQIMNTNPGVFTTHTVSGCCFENKDFSLHPEKIGIHIVNGLRDNIVRNDFINKTTEDLPYQQDYYIAGILTESSQGMKIAGNTMERLYFGVALLNTTLQNQTQGNTVGATFDGVHGSFVNCREAVATAGTNNTFQARCNVFDRDENLDLYNSSLRFNGTIPDQGANAISPYTLVVPAEQLPAGNVFVKTDTINNSRNVISSQNFTYFRHNRIIDDDGNIDSHSEERLTPIMTNLGTVALNWMQVDKTPCACRTDICVGSATTTMVRALTVQNEELEAERVAVEGSLDNGITAELLNDIQILSSSKLKKKLLANSPLSDQVLISYIENSENTPPGHFKEVMIPNSPVSDEVLPVLTDKLINLPPGIAKQIEEVQGYNSDARTVTMIDKEISWTDNLYQIKRNELISDQLNNGDYNDVISMLEED
ncbi:MAG: SprB repeat-containing protein, partial [Bacteroidetes bacterium]|nr:SprB repeat-containing protein [Bacteroidota bacterium]MBU1717993.1 SprB repeat-containing protein [Bacteroidota bacterium]